MSFAPGEIVLAAFPFTNLAGIKRRPCVVVGLGDDGNEFIVAFVTSNTARVGLPSAVPVEPAHREWKATGLKAASIVRPDKLVTLHTSIISGAIGGLPDDLMAQIRLKLKAVFQIP
ncbi:MAG TPA: type II toxin-antitoxin system PemK/MazF family toxin [Verrucomicrobiae bacterium]|jgi:mRNA interferase MazF